MRRKTFGALGFVIAMIAAGSAGAGASDYRFEAATPQVSPSPAAIIHVRLVHVPTGKPVAGAILLPARLEMPMAGAAPMIARAAPKGNDGKGTYELTADLSMTGTWTLRLAAKAQGEAETITAVIPIAVIEGAPADHSGHR